MQPRATRVTPGNSFGTQHIKIINFSNVVPLMNKFCKHFSSEWPDEVFSASPKGHTYCPLVYLNQTGTPGHSLLRAGRLQCALMAVYK